MVTWWHHLRPGHRYFANGQQWMLWLPWDGISRGTASTSFCSAKANHGAFIFFQKHHMSKVSKWTNSLIASADQQSAVRIFICCWKCCVADLSPDAGCQDWDDFDHTVTTCASTSTVTTSPHSTLTIQQCDKSINIYYHLFSLQKKWIVNTLSTSSDL